MVSKTNEIKPLLKMIASDPPFSDRTPRAARSLCPAPPYRRTCGPLRPRSLRAGRGRELSPAGPRRPSLSSRGGTQGGRNPPFVVVLLLARRLPLLVRISEDVRRSLVSGILALLLLPLLVRISEDFRPSPPRRLAGRSSRVHLQPAMSISSRPCPCPASHVHVQPAMSISSQPCPCPCPRPSPASAPPPRLARRRGRGLAPRARDTYETYRRAARQLAPPPGGSGRGGAAGERE